MKIIARATDNADGFEIAVTDAPENPAPIALDYIVQAVAEMLRKNEHHHDRSKGTCPDCAE